MAYIVFGVALALLIGNPRPVPASDADCQQFRQGSLANRECAYLHTAVAQTMPPESRSHRLGALPNDFSNVARFRCPDEIAAEIRDLGGAAGGEVRGSYYNPRSKAVREVIVGFALYSSRGELLDTVDAPVFPRVIPAGGRGSFTTYVPSQAGISWSCFRYEITGLVD